MDDQKLIKKLEKIAKVKRGEKYTQVLCTKDIDGDYEVHEYQSPLGFGYQIFLHKEVDGQSYTKTVGYGPEAEDRTHDWQEVIEYTINGIN